MEDLACKKCYLVLFRLLTDHPGLLKQIESNELSYLINHAFQTEDSWIIALLVKEGFLHRLPPQTIDSLIEKSFKMNFSTEIRSKIDNWYDWYSKGYYKFRGRYIFHEDVLVLQEIEQLLNIKIEYSPGMVMVISNYMFSYNDQRRVNKLHLSCHGVEMPQYLRGIHKKLPHLEEAPFIFKRSKSNY